MDRNLNKSLTESGAPLTPSFSTGFSEMSTFTQSNAIKAFLALAGMLTLAAMAPAPVLFLG